MMLQSFLPRVGDRLRLVAAIRGATHGLCVGAAMAVVLATAIVFGWIQAPVGNGIAMMIVSMAATAVLGMLAGWAVHAPGNRAAAAVDEHYGLKDRTLSATEMRQDTPVHRMVRMDADRHLEGADANDVVPMRLPATPLRWTAGLTTAAAIILMVHVIRATPTQARPVLAMAQTQASGLREEMLPELEKLVEETEDPELEKLLEELREKVDRMDSQSMDPSDLLAQLSSMESSLAAARAAMQIETTDALMQSLAAAIEPSAEMQDAAEALRAEDYERAAAEMQAIAPEKMRDQSRRAVANGIKKMVANLGPANPGSLSDTLAKLSEGLGEGNPGKCKSCLSKIAKLCEKQSQCKKAGQCLSRNLSLLSQCKCQCRGQCDSPFAVKSSSPSLNVGSAASNDPQGGSGTRIESTRQRKEITGMMGEQGDSETEILTSPEAQQSATRGYTAKYKDYRRQAEAVLQSEPLPQSHRQTVRTYFESIRPENESATTAR